MGTWTCLTKMLHWSCYNMFGYNLLATRLTRPCGWTKNLIHCFCATIVYMLFIILIGCFGNWKLLFFHNFFKLDNFFIFFLSFKAVETLRVLLSASMCFNFWYCCSNLNKVLLHLKEYNVKKKVKTLRVTDGARKRNSEVQILKVKVNP